MDIVIVVDMQNDFLKKGGALSIYHDHDTAEFIEDVRAFLRSKINDENTVVYFTQDTHQEDDCEFNMFNPHCIEATWGHEIVEELKEFTVPFDIIQKSSFTLPDPKQLLGRNTFQIVGVCSHICVHDVAVSIVNTFKECLGMIPEVTVYTNLTDDFKEHEQQEAYERLSTLYGVTVKEYTA